MVAELEHVHAILRRELEAVRDLAMQVTAGAPDEQVRARVEELAERSLLWRLRVHCLHFCRFVHGHHGYEDAAFFPRLRAANPALDLAIDRLEHEHRVVAQQLRDVESAAGPALAEADGRERLAAALDALGEHLLAHLAFEEEAILPTLRTMDDWRF